ncbi:hypothetical protein PPACK8108_LOCUS1488 [Phakopsora pachyrhizi]|uniref:Uncharacterized protein n=1 Tax=Phakopsora pachyrhizi TaxID=170000 RepID=A0AAV0AH64_PHAPC|nr:hypothetical protein PPACK8108_LOCUS1488 [Phakopsora pachyrhizi]
MKGWKGRLASAWISIKDQLCLLNVLLKDWLGFAGSINLNNTKIAWSGLVWSKSGLGLGRAEFSGSGLADLVWDWLTGFLLIDQGGLGQGQGRAELRGLAGSFGSLLIDQEGWGLQGLLWLINQFFGQSIKEDWGWGRQAVPGADRAGQS